MMKAIISILILLCFSTKTIGQHILQDNKGETALSLNPGTEKQNKDSIKKETVEFGLGQIKLSSSEKKLELNYYQYFRPDKRGPSFVGISASGEITNSIGSVFSSGDVAPAGEVKIKYGQRLFKTQILDFDEWEGLFKKKYKRDPTDPEVAGYVKGLSTASDLWFVINTGLKGSKFKLFYPDSAFTSQIKKINFTSFEVNAGFNFWSANIFKNVILIGATIGIKNSNNFDDLTESVSEEVTVRTNPSDTSTRKVTEKNTVYKGSYKETKAYPLNIDLYFKPHKFENVAFLLYCRNEMYKDKRPQTKLGTGFYFLRKNNLFDPVFGINIDFKDIFNNDKSDDEKSNWAKLSIGIVTDLNTLLFQKK